ncbi:TPA: hypothetical protein PIU23_005282 [Klebsiella quasipneumoniae subsp. similipneumoniae]|uniref:hypothetical protein n=1 Tax=Klebsiella quasipneumoniae TaxID=1463165 RepID=UPI000E2D1A38|nr:hypothetical protein [Klebsiella quasipneumoniae]SXD53003.1 Uncharacterised protein [Klebsiella quasipneumoniae]HCT6262468.1 hypothetical protein [Klebsiella quasipneumoniae]HDH1381964.1 hypothetical protein [Klebsiella quasipneumoniae subsp. similipneumoniae]HDU4851321.1 hypothetical protein [Klebsiella quasipneumoniae subsp. similipneumoniae]
MRISIFDQSNKNIVVFVNENRQVSVVKSYAETRTELVRSVKDRSAKARIKACDDKGRGHWYYAGYKSSVEDKNTKHVIVFMDDNRSHGVVFYRNGKNFEEYRAVAAASTSKGRTVWNLRTEDENSNDRVDELQLTNSFASTELTLEEALKIIEQQRKEIEDLVAQRDAAYKERDEAKRIQAKHYAKSKIERNKRIIAVKSNSSVLVEDIEAQLENFDVEPEEKPEIVLPVTEEVSPVMPNDETPKLEPVQTIKTITEEELRSLRVHNPMLYSIKKNQIKSGELVVI